MKIEHIGLFVSDLEAARVFYTKYFNGSAGAKYHNKKTGFSSYFISFPDGARLELCHQEKRKGHNNDGLGFVHLAFSLGSKQAVDEKTAELTQAGYELLSGPRTTGDGYYEAVVSDLEGNQLELTI